MSYKTLLISGLMLVSGSALADTNMTLVIENQLGNGSFAYSVAVDDLHACRVAIDEITNNHFLGKCIGHDGHLIYWEECKAPDSSWTGHGKECTQHVNTPTVKDFPRN